MSEQDYDRERERIREVYGDSKAEAATRWEQELAKLLWHSGWTQEELALKEGKGKSWISQRIIFGRFLDFSENSTVSGNLTEWAFRKYWERSDGASERRRFRHIAEMIEGETQKVPVPNANALMRDIRERYSDGKWHPAETIARHVDKPLEHVSQLLSEKAKSHFKTYKVEARGKGVSEQYRIVPTEKHIGSFELEQKLAPLIDELKAEGRKNPATIAITRIAKIAAELQQFVTEWTQ